MPVGRPVFPSKVKDARIKEIQGGSNSILSEEVLTDFIEVFHRHKGNMMPFLSSLPQLREEGLSVIIEGGNADKRKKQFKKTALPELGYMVCTFPDGKDRKIVVVKES